MNGPIKQIRERRRDILLLIATAVLLALAISCVTSYMAAITSCQPIWLLLSGIVCLLGGIFILKRIVLDPTDHVVRIRGAIAFTSDGDSIQPIEIIGYSFNRHFCEYLRGFLQENKAYARLFSQGKAGVVPMGDTFNPDDLNRHTIMNSVLEYTILDQLDLHLNSYFVDNEIDSADIVTLGREQLGPGVLRNRVIDVITRGMEERPAFTPDSKAKSADGVYSSIGEKDAVYQKLGIELPPRSTISRNDDGFLVIANPLFELVIVPQYEGFSTTVPNVLIPSAEGQGPQLLAIVKLHIRVKRVAYVTRESMVMYEWLDSFVEQMHEYLSMDRLERRLDPDLIKILRS